MSAFLSALMKRSSVTILITLLVVTMGIFSASTLPQELLPPIQFPIVSVITPYPLASPSVVEETVTEPLEKALSSIAGVQRIDSISNENVSLITVSFSLNTDLTRAEQQVTSVVNQVRSRLPDGVVQPTVATFGFADLPVMVASLSGDMEAAELEQVVTTKLLPAMNKVNGVGQIIVSGGSEQEVTVRLDPAKLAEYGLTTSSVSNALRLKGLVVPVGTITAGDAQIPVRVGDGLAGLADLENLVLTAAGAPAPTGAGGPPAGFAGAPPAAEPRLIRLKDVGSVQLSPAAAASLARNNGKPAIGIQVSKVADANTVKVARAVQDAMDQALAETGLPMYRTILFNQSDDITNSLSTLNREGLMGGLLAIFVILLFLRNLRSALVAAIAMPISILAALTLIRLQSFSLNIFSIGGLAIAVGRLVDDSIVVIENIYRKFLEGRPIREAVIEGTREVASAVAVSTITSVAVFLPLGLVGGIIAEFFRPLAFTVTYALLASMVTALTVIPVLTGLFMRSVKLKQTGVAVSEGTDFLARLYRPSLRLALRNKALVGLAALSLFGGSLFLAAQLATNLFTSQEQPNFQINLTMPPGSSLQRTDAEVRKVEEILGQIEGVKAYSVTVGGAGDNGLGDATAFAEGANSARFFVVTDQPKVTGGVIAEFRRQVAAMESPATIQAVLSSGGAPTSAKVELQVLADDPAVLATASEQIMARMQRVELVTNVSSTLSTSKPEISIRIREEAALALGLPDPVVSGALRDMLAGQKIGALTVDGKSLEVRIAPLIDQPASVEALADLRLASPLGQTVRLGDVADVSLGSGPASIRRLDGERVALVSADVIGDDTGAATRAVNAALADLAIPGAVWKAAGVQEQQAEAFFDLGMAIVASIFLVYLFMVIGLRSLVNPLLLLSAIPLAAIGSFTALYVTKTPLGVAAMLGMLILVGIVVSNGIVLIDLIEQYRAEGRDLYDAVMEGSARRVRPVVMTALTTVVGLMPLALGEDKGGGSFISKPLAVASIGGLLSATFLTLILVPVLYYAWNRLADRWASAPAVSGD